MKVKLFILMNGLECSKYSDVVCTNKLVILKKQTGQYCNYKELWLYPTFMPLIKSNKDICFLKENFHLESRGAVCVLHTTKTVNLVRMSRILLDYRTYARTNVIRSLCE